MDGPVDSTAEVRLKTEATQLAASPPPPGEMLIDPCVDGDLFRWKAVLRPDASSVFAGRRLPVDITVPTTHPADQPQMRFTEPVYHPNISTSGTTDMDTLSQKWDPALTIETMLRLLRTLLDEPDVHDPARPEVAELYVLAPQDYRRRARHGEDDSAS
ncbi:ubiquitin-conjugating enzyme E2 variant [Streptomyces sp. M-16]|uniref:ubiquitin-conjugating enzyme E2 variant n=1 Tax=Streptomyces sp. M-16 TaxID=3233040 RepID=UPI003F9E35A0